MSLRLVGWLLAAAAGAEDLYTPVRIPGSAEQIFLLTGSMSLRVEDGMFAELTTWVPECKWYRKIPCTCRHVIFHDAGGRFEPGFSRNWHRPTWERWLTKQNRFVSGTAQAETKYFWQTGGFADMKSSVSVCTFILAMFTDLFCSRRKECILTRSFNGVLNWLFSLTGFSLSDMEKHLRDYRAFLEILSQPHVVEEWRNAAWEILLVRPEWAATFSYVVELLEALLVQAAGAAAGDAPAAEGEDRFEQVLERLGGDCLQRGVWDVALKERRAGTSPVAQLKTAQEAAFDEACELQPVPRIVMFGHAIRHLLPGLPPDEVWGPASTTATALPGDVIYRLCGPPDAVIHRRVGQAEMHFLAADVVRIGEEVVLELLWLATSDDQCLMLGNWDKGPHGGKAYYSFLHTLPGGHLQHWRCQATLPGGRVGGERGHAVTLSFSGFASVTSCQLPPTVAAALLAPPAEGSGRGAGGTVLELTLAQDPGATGWEPEALRICALPRPRRFRIAACSAPLHGADRMHRIAPRLMEDWINYHKLVGVQHFTIFDTDGSYGPFLQAFVKSGVVTYRGRWPATLAPKLGILAEGVAPEDRRPMVTEPQALDACVFAYRQVSDWVLVLHSFEEYLHSPLFAGMVEARRESPVLDLLMEAARSLPKGSGEVAMFELFQEPMGGPRHEGARSVLSAWTHKRMDPLAGKEGQELKEATANHLRAFAWVVDPLNVAQTAIHLAQPRADGQAIVAMTPSVLRVNHYIDLGTNASRCLHELGGCEVPDRGILWAEPEVIRMRRPRGRAAA